jgi:hypothetical protein
MKQILRYYIYSKGLIFLLMLHTSLNAQVKSTIVQDKAMVDHFRFVGDHFEESMWSAVYAARSGKIYIGLCTHAEAAHFYEFDPATTSMRHIVDLTTLHNERGYGINTNGKIHVRMGEDKDGNIYLVGAIEEKEEKYVVGSVQRRWPFSMGLIAFDPADQSLHETTLRIPGEYWITRNYWGFPVVEQLLFDIDGTLYGSTSDGFDDYGVLGVDRSPYFSSAFWVVKRYN